MKPRWFGTMKFSGLVLALLLAAAAGRADAQDVLDQGGFVLRIGSDTLAIERFTRGAGVVRGELAVRMQGVRVAFTLGVQADEAVSRFELTVRRQAAPEDAPPEQRLTIAFQADSAVMESTSGDSTRTRRVAVPSGSLPFVNPSFTLFEQALRRARALGGDSLEVPLFVPSGGGQNLPARVAWKADSAVVAIAGIEIRVHSDATGRVLGGAVPAQNLRVERVAAVSEAAFSGTKPDYSAPADAPYAAEDVKAVTPAGHTLAGTLTLPRDVKGRVPAIVLISGSGPQERDESIMSRYRPFRDIAHALSRRGLAVLRYDDRGAGESTGEATDATTADFAEDVRALLAYLRGRPDIDARRLGVVGHSEGAMIGPMVAAEDRGVRALVLIAGPAWTGRRILESQFRYLVEHNPAIRPEARDSAVAAQLARADSARAGLPWLRFFYDYDPLPTARRVRTPVLILQGATDRQVAAEQADELARAFRAGGNRDVSVRVFPEVNHLLLRDPSGNPLGYFDLTVRDVAPELLQSLGDWLTRKLR